MLELMARGGMRIGEVLKLRACDVEEHRLHLIDPKSGKPPEVVFIPRLRHANLSTTQRYLGKISDTEAIRWIETVYS